MNPRPSIDIGILMKRGKPIFNDEYILFVYFWYTFLDRWILIDLLIQFIG